MVQNTGCRLALLLLLGAMALVNFGCASYQRAPVAADAPAGTWPEGTNVRVVLHSGDKYTGRILRSTTEEIALDGLGNYGESEIVLSLADVDYVEVRQQSDGEIEQGWFILLGVALVTTFFLSNWGLN